MVRFYNINGNRVQFTDEEETARDLEEKQWSDDKSKRQLQEIREIRNQKLLETDYLATSDNTMNDEMKAFRKSMRDIPQDYDSSKYDELLDRINMTEKEIEDKKTGWEKQGQLTHSIWSKP